jgi:hypothetical protein
MAAPVELFGERALRSRLFEPGATDVCQIITDEEVREQLLAPTGTRDTEVNIDTWSISAGTPLSAGVRCERTFELEREGWSVRVHAVSEMTCDETSFHVSDSLEAYEGGEPVFGRTSEIAIPRDLV